MRVTILVWEVRASLSRWFGQRPKAREVSSHDGISCQNNISTETKWKKKKIQQTHRYKIESIPMQSEISQKRSRTI